MLTTAEDRTRNLPADLLLCECALPGPWISVPNATAPGWAWRNAILRPEGVPDEERCVAARVEHTGTRLMLAASCVAWPAAIRRAIDAEQQLAQLKFLLLRLTDDATITSPDEAHERLDMIREEAKKL